MRAIILLVATLISMSSAVADSLDITADGFIEMNETHRAALVHGALASMIAPGVGENYTEALSEGWAPN